MLAISHVALLAGTLLVALALVAHMAAWAAGRSAAGLDAPRPVAVTTVPAGPQDGPGCPEEDLSGPGSGSGSTAGAGVGAGSGAGAALRAVPASGLRWYGDALIGLALVGVTAALFTRMVAVGHGPFASQYEFAVSFAWGVLGAHLYLVRRHGLAALALLVLPVAAGMLLYAAVLGGQAAPLVPALRNDMLLTLHVLTAVLAYGAAAVAAAAGVMYLVSSRLGGRGLPGADALDALGYRAVVVSFPLMTLMIALGAVWADIAWGTYWSWDPKETASLVTWLIYGAYLHARVTRGWRGRRSAWLLVLGFGAVLFTYFGNLFLGGMHSYA